MDALKAKFNELPDVHAALLIARLDYESKCAELLIMVREVHHA